jgi:hypothetical protein
MIKEDHQEDLKASIEVANAPKRSKSGVLTANRHAKTKSELS